MFYIAALVSFALSLGIQSNVPAPPTQISPCGVVGVPPQQIPPHQP